MKDRNERRKQKERLKRRAKRFLKNIWHVNELAENDTFVGIHSDTRVRCSNPLCCGNHRRISNSEKNKSIQERKADLDEREE